MKQLIILCFGLLSLNSVKAQTVDYKADSTALRAIFDTVLNRGQCHQNLFELCKDIGHRITASPASYKAIAWGKSKLEELDLDSVWLQPITVPHWVRGSIERLDFSCKTDKLYISNCTALGGSIGTEGNVLAGNIVEVRSWDELDALDPEDIKGKVVFYNRPMNPSLINTFAAYGDCSQYRVYGASKAAKLGAIGIILRSVTLRIDDNPHTGIMYYEEDDIKIPGVAISARDAYNLSNMLKSDPNTSFKMKLSCKTLPDTISYNVIGEIKGSEKPDEIILVGGHLDSWDIGEGAHDDGAGVVQSIETMRLFNLLKIKPKRTIRCVLYMNEENGNRGGKGYAKYAEEYKENHIFALETDRGGFSPRGFSVDATDDQFENLQAFKSLFLPYYIHIIKKGYGGVDIGPLKKTGDVCLVGLMPDSQRYFDFHHAKSDVWENVNQRELELGAGAIASMVYLIDKYGI